MTSADLVTLIKKHPASFACLLLCLVSGVLIYLRYGNISAGQDNLEARSSELSRMISNIRNSVGLPEQVAGVQAHTKELESRLLKASQLADNLQYFYRLETENGVKLLDVRQNPLPRNTRSTAYVGVPFNVSVQGTYTQVMNFLNRLQHGRHLCRINTANFSKVAAADRDGPMVNLSLNLELLGRP
jgi:Tfp pilus assembly protein PilO